MMKTTCARILLRSVQIFALALVVYLLSPGPLTLVLRRIDKNREWDDVWLQNLYLPINWANEHSPTFRNCMAHYLALWSSSDTE